MQGAYERPRDDANEASPREDTVLTMQLQAAPRAGGGGGAAHAGPWATVRRVGPRWWAITRLWFTSKCSPASAVVPLDCAQPQLQKICAAPTQARSGGGRAATRAQRWGCRCSLPSCS